jgi:hypothetical protein
MPKENKEYIEKPVRVYFRALKCECCGGAFSKPYDNIINSSIPGYERTQVFGCDLCGHLKALEESDWPEMKFDVIED